MPDDGLSPRPSQQDLQEIIRLANIIYFRSRVHERTSWMGVGAMKCPMDMWVYQELMFNLKTDLVIETGTASGGSALFFAHMLDIIGEGRVVSIDIDTGKNRPEHPRISYLHGSSISKEIIQTIGRFREAASSILVILDSDHQPDFKLEELNAYARFVTPGSYMIAEDTTFDYFPAWPEFGPGPASAVRKFLSNTTEFEADRDLEKHLITFAPLAFLRRGHAA